MSPDIEAGKRSWVFEALMMLVEKKPYNKITMEDIAKKAGISRQTLYRLFTDKDDIISQFLTAAADSGLLSIESEHESGKPDTIVILCNAEFVGKHYGVLKKMLADAHIHDLISSLTKEKIVDIIQYYKARLPPSEYEICEYKLIYQITGCFVILTHWLNNGMPQPIDKLVDMINAMAQPKEKTWRHLPNIEMRFW